jgi:hypothetical protein
MELGQYCMGPIGLLALTVMSSPLGSELYPSMLAGGMSLNARLLRFSGQHSVVDEDRIVLLPAQPHNLALKVVGEEVFDADSDFFSQGENGCIGYLNCRFCPSSLCPIGFPAPCVFESKEGKKQC